MLCFYNTLTARKEPFSPLQAGQVRMYTCGPTVYEYAHLGNFRTFVSLDILGRYLKCKGFRLKHVMNYTDVDDKTIRNAQQAGLELRAYTEKFIEAFQVDCRLLNIETPETVVRATDHIDDMAKMVEGLVAKGHAYHSDNSTYFRISSFPAYGRLSRIDLSGMKAGARVDQDEYEKDDVRDFVLWKASKPGEPCWDTSFGCGRPGWHLECSVMSMKYLGESFDIHAGGTDLIFPHHENEIAQSESLTGKPFVRTWVHVEHLLVEGKKMAKSVGNYFTLRDLLKKGYKPSAIRYLLASVPHRKQLNFTFDALHQAQQSLERLRNFQYRLQKETFAPGEDPDLNRRATEAKQKFEEAMDDDLNTARAFAAVFDLVRDGNTAMDESRFQQGNIKACLEMLEVWDRIFGALPDDDHKRLAELDFIQPDSKRGSGGEGSVSRAAARALSDSEIEAQIEEREQARRARDFARADEVRKVLDQAGIFIEDTKAGTRWKRK